MSAKKNYLKIIGPGILVAATGVGAGDLAMATLTGASLGTAVLWAVLLGAGLKFILNEGLTRWQLVTGTTLLEGAVRHLKGLMWFFAVYLVVWSFLVAMALMSACGVAAHAIFPIFEDASTDKTLYGVLHSIVAVVLVVVGGYRLFEKTMAVCIGLMFIVCVSTALLLMPNAADVAFGIFIPTIPDIAGQGLNKTVALLGGVGGTVTVLCYGYWIREEGRNSPESLGDSRIDLAVGYGMTAIFGVAMVVIGAALGEVEGKGAALVVNVADLIEKNVPSGGLAAKWAFLIGAWGAVFSSLLGVWQAVPYIFCDFGRLLFPAERNGSETDARVVDTRSATYRTSLLALATSPIVGLYAFDFATAMLVNGIIGALFIPMLASTLLYLCGGSRWLGSHRNSKLTNAALIFMLALFLVTALFKLYNTLTFAG